MFRGFDERQTDTRSNLLVQSYERTLFWSRLVMAAFFVVYVATLVWAIPWFPYGLAMDDYNERTAPLLVLLLAASTTAFGAVYLRERRKRMEQTLRTWNSVHDGLGDLRRREYFYDRIVIECERARARRSQFSIFVLKVGAEGIPATTDEIAKALGALEPMVKELDCLASISQQEIGVLAPLVPADQAPELAKRIRALVSYALNADYGTTQVRSAYAVYERDAVDAGELVGVARSRLIAKPGVTLHASPGDHPAAAA
jgi:GGDEF domain-containing protein